VAVHTSPSEPYKEYFGLCDGSDADGEKVCAFLARMQGSQVVQSELNERPSHSLIFESTEEDAWPRHRCQRSSVDFGDDLVDGDGESS
jgi:hypothetical protein